MPKVYLVSSGSYSDYSIVGAFSTRESAEAYIAENKSHHPNGYTNFNDVEEFDLDAPREMLPGCWQASVGVDGALIDASWTEHYLPTNEAWTDAEWKGDKATFWGFGMTEEHARRSAEELRRRTLVLAS